MDLRNGTDGGDCHRWYPLCCCTSCTYWQVQERAYSSSAKQQAVQYAKEILGGGTLDNADVTAVTSGDVTNTATTCGNTAAYAYTGGGDTWTVTLDGGIPGAPVKS